MSQRQIIAVRKTGLANKRHGYTSGKISPEWTCWHMMRQRCKNPNNKSYNDYGGRGIRVCSEWEVFENFIADMGPKPSSIHSIGRIDNDSGYSKSNCRWESRKQQYANRRSSRFENFNGEIKTVSEWASEYKVQYQTLLRRLKRGWSMDDALNKPNQLYGKYSRKKRN